MGLLSFGYIKYLRLAPDFKADWNFIQNAGGIKLGKTEKLSSDTWAIHFDCNVSGIREITVKPTTLNSALIVSRVLHIMKERDLFITLSLNTASNKEQSAICPNLVLKNLSSGEYKVYYKDQSCSYLLGSMHI